MLSDPRALVFFYMNKMFIYVGDLPTIVGADSMMRRWPRTIQIGPSCNHIKCFSSSFEGNSQQSRQQPGTKNHSASNTRQNLLNGGRKDLLTLADLSFCMPDCDELWNAPLGAESEVLNQSDSSAVARDNGNAKNWIYQASALLHDARIGFDWI